MKVLLDECLPFDLRHSFPGHEAHSVVWAGLKGLKNGDLLRAAESAGYEVLVTVDQGIHQQNLTRGRLSVIVLKSGTNQLEDLQPLVNKVLKALEMIKTSELVVIRPSEERDAG